MAKRKRPPVTLHAHPVLDPPPGADEVDMIIAYSQRKDGLDPDDYHEYTGACLSLSGPMALALSAAWEREDALIEAFRKADRFQQSNQSIGLSVFSAIQGLGERSTNCCGIRDAVAAIVAAVDARERGDQ